MREFHPAARIAMAQLLVVILGLVGCFISRSENWHSWTRVVRYGFPILLLMPLGWMILAMRMENKPDSRWSEGWTLITGLLLLAALVLLLGITAFDPASWRTSPLRDLGAVQAPSVGMG